MERVCGAFVPQDEDVWGEVRFDPAGAVGVGWRESIAVVAVSSWRFIVPIVHYILIGIFCDSRRRAAGMSEWGVTPSAAGIVAAHEEEKGDYREEDGS